MAGNPWVILWWGGKTWRLLELAGNCGCCCAVCTLACTLQPGWVQPLAEAKYIIMLCSYSSNMKTGLFSDGGSSMYAVGCGDWEGRWGHRAMTSHINFTQLAILSILTWCINRFISKIIVFFMPSQIFLVLKPYKYLNATPYTKRGKVICPFLKEEKRSAWSKSGKELTFCSFLRKKDFKLYNPGL